MSANRIHFAYILELIFLLEITLHDGGDTVKVLIVPMSAVAQTEGPFSRAEILAKTFWKAEFR